MTKSSITMLLWCIVAMGCGKNGENASATVKPTAGESILNQKHEIVVSDPGKTTKHALCVSKHAEMSDMLDDREFWGVLTQLLHGKVSVRKELSQKIAQNNILCRS